jgi:hypothetical protein
MEFEFRGLYYLSLVYFLDRACGSFKTLLLGAGAEGHQNRSDILCSLCLQGVY